MTDALDKQAHDTAKLLADSAERIHDDLDRMARLLAKMRGLCFVTPSELDKIERLRQVAKEIDHQAKTGSVLSYTFEGNAAFAELDEVLNK